MGPQRACVCLSMSFCVFLCISLICVSVSKCVRTWVCLLLYLCVYVCVYWSRQQIQTGLGLDPHCWDSHHSTGPPTPVSSRGAHSSCGSVYSSVKWVHQSSCLMGLLHGLTRGHVVLPGTQQAPPPCTCQASVRAHSQHLCSTDGGLPQHPLPLGTLFSGNWGAS